MKRKKKNKKNFIIIILFVAFLAYFIYYSNNKHNYLWFEGNLKDAVSSIYRVINKRITIDYKNVSDTLTDREREEIKELKSLLELNESGIYALENSMIISRNTDIYFKKITIDKGQKNGIKQGMIAINQNGLVGIVERSTKKTSEIKLLTSNEINVAVTIGNNEINAILTGYDESDNKLIVETIRKDVEIQNGDIVVTNGLGNLFPSGIEIGNVIEVIDTDSLDKKILKVSSNVDFSKLKYISVIKEVLK